MANFELAVTHMAADLARKHLELCETEQALVPAKKQLESYKRTMSLREKWSLAFLFGGDQAKVDKRNDLERIAKDKERKVAEVKKELADIERSNTDYIHEFLMKNDLAYQKIVRLIEETLKILASAKNVSRELEKAGSDIGSAQAGEFIDALAFVFLGGIIGGLISVVSWNATNESKGFEDLKRALEEFSADCKNYKAFLAGVEISNFETPYLGLVNNVGLAADLLRMGGPLFNVVNYLQLGDTDKKITSAKERFEGIEETLANEIERIKETRIKYIANIVTECQRKAIPTSEG